MLAPGAVFAGRYVVEQLLRQGGMGAVYVVRHVRTHARLALKVMRPEIALDAAMRERFAREAQVSSLIQSAHVVTVVDADVDAGSGMPFLVMELLHGSDLGELVRKGPLPYADVARFVAQTARALDRAHALGIVHRDLKPENLFLATSDDDPDRIKVLDFGIAKIVQAATLLGQSQHIGTPLYMAPEQMKRGHDIGPWTDVWSLGLTAYTLLVGRPYWEGETVHEIYAEILLERRASPSARSGGRLPPSFDAWFARCTDPDPTRRFATAGAAATALATVLGAPETPAPPPGFSPRAIANTAPMTAVATEPMAQHTQLASAATSNRRAAGSGAVVGAVALIVVAIAIARRTPEPTQVAASPSAEPSMDPSTGKPKKKAPLAAIEGTNPFVTISSFSMQRHEVTRGEWAVYLASLGEAHEADALPLAGWNDPNASAEQPVVWITHRRATAFCRAIGARLPTGDEWTQALAGETYPWGKQFPPPGAVAFDRPTATTLPAVESFASDRTKAGIFDLFGSVREWTADVDGGFAAVRGVALGTAKKEAASLFATPSLKDVEEGPDPSARAAEIAGPQIGFRCAR